MNNFEKSKMKLLRSVSPNPMTLVKEWIIKKKNQAQISKSPIKSNQNILVDSKVDSNQNQNELKKMV